jgi:hypothetical protein
VSADHDPNFWTNFAGIAYYLVGLPVAWWHMRRENITREDAPDLPGNRGFRFLVLILAVLWPVLLLAIGATWLSNRMDEPPANKP